MPQEQRHREQVHRDDGAPRTRPLQPAGHGPARGGHQRHLQAPQREQGQGRRRLVGGRRRRADHPDRVAQRPHEDRQRPSPREPERQARGRAVQQSAVPPDAQLRRRGPHQQVVEAARRDPGPAQRVDAAHEQREDDHHRGPGALVQREQQGGERDDHEVDAQEPQGDERVLRADAGRLDGEQPQRDHGGTRHDPEPDHRQGRAQQARGAAPHPVGVGDPVAHGPAPGARVDDPADQEEHRHDLQDPGEPGQARLDVQRAGGAQHPVLHPDRGQQPVAQHDDGDGHPAEGVEVAVAVRRRRVRQRAGGPRRPAHRPVPSELLRPPGERRPAVPLREPTAR